MANYLYTYLMMGIIFFIFWVGLFYWRKDSRHQMVAISLITGLLGPIADVLYLKDWWTPQFIFGAGFNIEAFIVGFMIGGIGTVSYETVFHKKIINRRRTKKQREVDFYRIGLLISLGIAVYFGSFVLVGLNSLYSTILGLFVPTMIVWQARTDLIIPSLITGVLLVPVAVLVYSLLEIITPGWVMEFWHFKNTPPVILVNVPLDDLVWYFTAGLFIGPLYEYWHEARFGKL